MRRFASYGRGKRNNPEDGLICRLRQRKQCGETETGHKNKARPALEDPFEKKKQGELMRNTIQAQIRHFVKVSHVGSIS